MTRVAVVTIAHGRHEHLAAQHRSLARGTVRPDHYLAVAMDDPAIVEEQVDGFTREVVAVGRGPGGGLPLAAARNLGVRTAIDAGADVVAARAEHERDGALVGARARARAEHCPDRVAGQRPHRHQPRAEVVRQAGCHVLCRARPEADQRLGDPEPQQVGRVVTPPREHHADGRDAVEPSQEQHLDRDVDDEEVGPRPLEPRAQRRSTGPRSVVQQRGPVEVPVGRHVAGVAVVVAGQSHPVAGPAVRARQRRQARDRDALAAQPAGEDLGPVAVSAADVVDVVADDPCGAVAGHAASSWRVSSA